MRKIVPIPTPHIYNLICGVNKSTPFQATKRETMLWICLSNSLSLLILTNKSAKRSDLEKRANPSLLDMFKGIDTLLCLYILHIVFSFVLPQSDLE